MFFANEQRENTNIAAAFYAWFLNKLPRAKPFTGNGGGLSNVTRQYAGDDRVRLICAVLVVTFTCWVVATGVVCANAGEVARANTTADAMTSFMRSSCCCA